MEKTVQKEKKHRYITSKKDPYFSKLLLLFLMPLWLFYLTIKTTSDLDVLLISIEEQFFIIKLIYVASLLLILNWLRHYKIYTIYYIIYVQLYISLNIMCLYRSVDKLLYRKKGA